MEFLVILIIILISAIFNWLKKRSEEAEDWTELDQPSRPGAPPPAPRQERKSFDWEAELRRMLELDRPRQAPPQPPPVPPPIVRHEPARIPSPSQTRTPRRVEQANLERLWQGAAAAERAVAAQRSQPRRPPVTALGQTISRQRRGPEVERAVALFRHPQSARQAVVVSAIFGAPKGLE